MSEWNLLTQNQPVNYAVGTGLANTLAVKSSPGALYRVLGYSNKNAGQWIQVFDAASPVNGSIIAEQFVAASGNFNFDFGSRGVQALTAISVGNSSSPTGYLAGSADCYFSAIYK